jgi:hypothetical protein
MRRRKLHIMRFAALVLAAGAASAPAATADVRVFSERTSDHRPASIEVTGDALPPECAAWARAMSLQLSTYGIFGAQADSYIAQRADYPCHRPITARSLFHAGDPA